MRDLIIVVVVLVIQGVSGLFFVLDILSARIGITTTPISWQLRELLEIGAALGLLAGFLFGAYALWRMLHRSRKAEDALRQASAAFMDILDEKFDEWALTPAERDVALFSIKGLSTREIAQLRQTSEGTIKAQANAIYRKAGVSGRPQLLSLFIEDLIDGRVADVARQAIAAGNGDRSRNGNGDEAPAPQRRKRSISR